MVFIYSVNRFRSSDPVSIITELAKKIKHNVIDKKYGRLVVFLFQSKKLILNTQFNKMEYDTQGILSIYKELIFVSLKSTK